MTSQRSLVEILNVSLQELFLKSKFSIVSFACSINQHATYTGLHITWGGGGAVGQKDSTSLLCVSDSDVAVTTQ